MHSLGSRCKTAVILVLLSCTCWVGLVGCSLSAAVQRPYLLDSTFGDPQTFNYYLSNGNTSSEVILLTLLGLTTLDPETLDWKPELAEKWDVYDDGLRIVFTMRQGLQWSDGAPLTAEDVEFTFNDIIFNEKIPTSSRDVMRIGESGQLPLVTLLDERRVEFRLPEPFAPFFQVAVAPLMPKHLLEAALKETDKAGNPKFLKTWSLNTPVNQLVGSGPYLLEEYIPNQRIAFKTNPHYWKKGSQGESLPKIPRIVRQIVASQDNQLLQFRSGSLDEYELRASDFQLLKHEEDRSRFTIYNLGQTLDNSFFCFNLSKGTHPKTGQPVVSPVKSRWFNDVNFRQAVSYAIDRQAIVDSVLRGLGAPQTSVISPASPYYLSPEEGLPVYEYNPEKAKALLIKSGFRYNAQNRLLDLAGNPVRFTLNTNVGNSDREATGSLIKSDLDKIGIRVDFVPIEFSTLVNKFTSTFDWDAVMLSLGGGGTEPNSGANTWRSTGQLHMWNHPAIPNREVTDWEREIDTIFVAGTRELEFEKRKALYDRFQIVVQEQLPLISTINPLSLVALRDRLQGTDPRPILGALWNLDKLVLEP
jgi:peptide/nickel transport system substrate-binding protein